MPIKKILTEGRVPVKIWTDDVEDEALKQLEKAAKLPFIFKHIAVMPDVHGGIGCTVGSVIATKGAMCPATLGVDIGCGMMAVKLDVNAKEVQDKVVEIRKSIERSVPVGFNEHQLSKSPGQSAILMGDMVKSIPVSLAGLGDYQKAIKQYGSLGGGNHFIELCTDTENNVWVMLHSGSRGIGNKIGNYFINEAKGLMKKMFIELPTPDLAYLVQGTKEFDDYKKAVDWAQAYAFGNRQAMMDLVLKDLSYALGKSGAPLHRVLEVNCHHNYMETENHYGENVLVTRKGAVRAREGDFGIIPGSMGAKSFIVRGKGNMESFCSCSHGAGRKMSRTKAKSVFTKEDLAEQTRGIECRKDEGVIDEIPGAYKPIDEVIANQSDLVEVVAELKQFMCIKG